MDECPPAVRALLGECGITLDVIASRCLAFEPEAAELVVAEVDESGREHRLTPAAARAWRGMRAAAEADGGVLHIAPAFRDIERQAQIIRGQLAKSPPIDEIPKASAPP